MISGGCQGNFKVDAFPQVGLLYVHHDFLRSYSYMGVKTAKGREAVGYSESHEKATTAKAIGLNFPSSKGNRARPCQQPAQKFVKRRSTEEPYVDPKVKHCKKTDRNDKEYEIRSPLYVFYKG